MAQAWRWFAIVGAPLGLGALAAIHPIVTDELVPRHQVALWTLIHTLQVPLAALLGVALLLLLDRSAGRSARIARLAVVPWIAFFAAFDGVAGLATGAIAQYGHNHPAHAGIAAEIGHLLADSPVVAAALPLLALAFAVGAFGGTALALRRTGVPYGAAVCLAMGGIGWTFIHPIVGAPAMALFVIGAVVAERSRVAARGRVAIALATA